MLKKSSKNVGSQLIDVENNEVATTASFTEETYVLIHGFTANGSYLKDLAESLAAHGKKCLIFDYNSYKGIDSAAYSFLDLMFTLFDNENLSPKKQVILVGHSMGGLVAREIAHNYKESDYYIDKIITLGTPHLGAFINKNLINYFVKWSQHITCFHSKIDSNCLSARQLLGLDDEPGKRLIDRLNNNIICPIISFSGGSKEISVSSNIVLNKIANIQIQKIYKGLNNDGLVHEGSSDITNIEANKTRHINTYNNYDEINHSNLIFNQFISSYIAKKC